MGDRDASAGQASIPEEAIEAAVSVIEWRQDHDTLANGIPRSIAEEVLRAALPFLGMCPRN